MASQATTAEETHSYYPTTPWAQTSSVQTPAISGSASPGTAAGTKQPATSWSASPTPHLSESPNSSRSSPQVDFWPLLFPHHASLYQAQLLHYSNLVSPGRGGGLQQPHLPHSPNVASSQSPSASRSRASSRVSNKDRPSNRTEKGHGNKAAAQNKEKGDRAGITGKEAQPPNMSHQKQPQASQGEQGKAATATLPHRTRTSSTKQASQPHSSSVPSTPQQHARNFSYESREPSPTNHNNHSPRSAYSETNSALPSLRPLPQKTCPFETAQIRARRRMPYNIGSGPLERADLTKIKSKLKDDEERKLTTDMREIFDRLLPTEKVEQNRTKLCAKLEKLFNDEWPGHDIRVHLFGSSGNLLCSDDSDVDICITTPWKELEGVCSIAELLHRKGMEKVVCISAAKVPIVKIWDPELGLACDMNVNNTLALENTRMVRTYIEIDPRVRQLAMIIKFWTRRRELNDAAFGGTLSSYTWICMIIAFLQLREPPILPALHQRPHQRLPKKGDEDSSFADDVDKLRGFGEKNKSSLGDLLFQFFRFYAHDFDYEKHVLSVRQGKKLLKTDKKWLHDFCVEEPFNTSRNLGNTADEYSFRGLHIELRRAFDLISEGKLDEACETFVFPKEEPSATTFVRPQNQSRPVIIRSSSQQQPNRGKGFRGGRHSNNSYRNGGSSRRASSSVAYDTNTLYMPQVAMTTQDLASWYQQQAPAQAGQQLQYPAILYTQSQVYQHMQQMAQYAQQQQQHQQQQQRMQGSNSGSSQTPTQGQQQQGQQQGQQQQQSQGTPTDRSRTNSFDNPPMSAPIAGPDWFSMYAFQYPAMYGQQQGFAYPPSPATSTTAANTSSEYRRGLQRSAMSNEAGGSSSGSSLRSQSQPASRSMNAAQPGQPFSGSAPTVANGIAGPRHGGTSAVPNFTPDDAEYDSASQRPMSDSPASDDGPGAYIGYYVSDAPSPSRMSQMPQHPAVANNIAFGDMTQSATGRRRLSTDQLPQTLLDRRIRRASRSPSPLGHARALSTGTSPNGSSPVAQQTAAGNRTAARPLVVNGTGSSALRTSSTPSQHSEAQATAEEIIGGKSPISYDNPLQISGHGFSSHQASSAESQCKENTSPPPPPPPPQAALPERTGPLIVNGSTGATVGSSVQSAPPSAVPQLAEEASFRDRIMNQHVASNTMPPQDMANGFMQGNGFASPSSWQKQYQRQPHSGMIAPLDLATSNSRSGFNPLGLDSQHLSPINETRSPSPTTVRKGDNFFARVSRTPTMEGHPESAKSQGQAYADASASLKHSSTQPSTSTSNGGARAGPSMHTTHPLQTSQTIANLAPTSQPRSQLPRENGHSRVKSDGIEGGWQKSNPKSKKKGGQTSFVPSEPPPKNDADRKGG